MGDLKIRVPRDSMTTIHVHHGMGDVDVRGMVAAGNTYTVQAPGGNGPRITCQVKQGIGSVSLEAV